MDVLHLGWQVTVYLTSYLGNAQERHAGSWMFVSVNFTLSRNRSSTTWGVQQKGRQTNNKLIFHPLPHSCNVVYHHKQYAYGNGGLGNGAIISG